MEDSLVVSVAEGFRASAEGLFGYGYLASVHKGNGLLCSDTAFWSDIYSQGLNILTDGPQKPYFLCVLCSVEAFKSKFSCLTFRKSFFSPVMTDFSLFDCSTLNWSNSIWTLALHTVQIKVSEQHSSVAWSN